MFKIYRFALAALCVSLSGCGGAVGLAVGAIGRSVSIGDDYATWKSSMPAIQPGTGRLVVYITGRSFTLYSTQMAMGGSRMFAVDNDVCGVIEDSFMYHDVPAGDHEVSAGDMIMLFGRFRRGKYSIKIKVADGRATYLRFDPAASEDAGPAPRVVDAATAETEMAKLPIDTHPGVSSECYKDRAQARDT